MQTLAVSFVIGLVLFQSPSEGKKSDRERDGLVGNVRSMLLEISRLSEESGKVAEGERFGRTVTRYDSNGSLTEVVQFGDPGIILSRTVYARDEEGNIVQTRYNANMTGQSRSLPTTLKCKVKYDSTGNKAVEVCSDDARRSSTRTEYQYENKNRRVILQIDVDGIQQSKCVETLGDRQEVMEHSCYNSNGIASFVRQTFTYEFDSTGNWIKRYSSAWQKDNDQLVFIGKDVVHRTISYDPTKDVSPNDATRVVDSLPDRPFVIRKSGGVLQESATKRVTPSYPREALAAGVSGSVIVELRVSENGKVEKAEAVSGHVELRDAAVDAAKQWEFRPTLLSGRAVKVIGRITFNFNK